MVVVHAERTEAWNRNDDAESRWSPPRSRSTRWAGVADG